MCFAFQRLAKESALQSKMVFVKVDVDEASVSSVEVSINYTAVMTKKKALFAWGGRGLKHQPSQINSIENSRTEFCLFVFVNNLSFML